MDLNNVTTCHILVKDITETKCYIQDEIGKDVIQAMKLHRHRLLIRKYFTQVLPKKNIFFFLKKGLPKKNIVLKCGNYQNRSLPKKLSEYNVCILN